VASENIPCSILLAARANFEAGRTTNAARKPTRFEAWLNQILIESPEIIVLQIFQEQLVLVFWSVKRKLWIVAVIDISQATAMTVSFVGTADFLFPSKDSRTVAPATFFHFQLLLWRLLLRPVRMFQALGKKK